MHLEVSFEEAGALLEVVFMVQPFMCFMGSGSWPITIKLEEWVHKRTRQSIPLNYLYHLMNESGRVILNYRGSTQTQLLV